MDELICPGLDDLGYEFWREAQLEMTDGTGTWQHMPSEPYRLHWQYATGEPFPACGRGPAEPLLTRKCRLVTCRSCRQSGPYLAAISPEAVAA